MAQHVMAAEINKFLGRVEECLNIVGYVPILSEISGAFRIAMGKIEFIAGLFLAAVGFVCEMLVGRGDRQWMMEQGGEYVLHGLVNILRGCVEMVFLLGNLACYIFDEDETNRFRYTHENPVHLRRRLGAAF